MRAIGALMVDLFGLESLVDRALAEDLGAGDITTQACIDADAKAVAQAVARTDLVVCGGPVFALVCHRVDPSLAVELNVLDGTKVKGGSKIFRIEGRARSILSAERVALNFVQRMSGIATLTRAHVDALTPGSRTRITDTRKTTPGLRALERYAVRMGGGHNHRDNLGAAVLIKDNHIAACGGVRAAIERARAWAPHTSRIECEVDTRAQLDEALAAGADIVLLDNMTNDAVREAKDRVAGRAFLEVSGGITLERIRELSAIGIDAISVGRLTHSAAAADIALDFV